MALSSNKLKFTTGIDKNMSRNEESCGDALVYDIRDKISLLLDFTHTERLVQQIK